jgi:hypothetical protein
MPLSGLKVSENEDFATEKWTAMLSQLRRCFWATEGKNRIKLAAVAPVIYCQFAGTRSM